MRWFLCVLAVVAVVGLIVSDASAGTIYPVNDGFELPDIGTGASTNGGVTGWTTTADFWVGITRNGGDFGMAGATNGNQNGGATSTDGQALWVTNGATASQTITLSAGVYNIQFDAMGRSYTYNPIGVEIIDSASVTHNLGTFNPGAQYVDYWSRDLTTTNVALPAGATTVKFIGLTSEGTETSYIDNVRVNTIPEPSTIILTAYGLIGLLAYAWRKRK